MGRGALWRRRPTRWLLGGLDGVKDWELEAYAHEPLANQVRVCACVCVCVCV